MYRLLYFNSYWLNNFYCTLRCMLVAVCRPQINEYYYYLRQCRVWYRERDCIWWLCEYDLIDDARWSVDCRTWKYQDDGSHSDRVYRRCQGESYYDRATIKWNVWLIRVNANVQSSRSLYHVVSLALKLLPYEGLWATETCHEILNEKSNRRRLLHDRQKQHGRPICLVWNICYWNDTVVLPWVELSYCYVIDRIVSVVSSISENICTWFHCELISYPYNHWVLQLWNSYLIKCSHVTLVISSSPQRVT